MNGIYTLLADSIVILHFFFIVFAVFGGFLLFWSKRFLWIHLPTVIWAAYIELSGWICPLTPLENLLRQKGGDIAYRSGFIEHYIVPVIYPDFLTRNIQIALGCFVLMMNIFIYGVVFRRIKKRKRKVRG